MPARLKQLLRPFTADATRRDRWILFACFVLLTIFRLPEVVFRGRFWAEEGWPFYYYAATLPWYRMLFHSYAGYMNFGANIATLAARDLVPLEYAPRITLAFSMAAQLAPALLLVTTRVPWLRARLALACALFLLVAAPSAEEVWLNTLHSQFHLGLAVALLLALEPELGWFRKFLLFLAPLYGVVAIMMLPLFVARTLIDRSRPRLTQTAILAAGSAIQLLFFYHQVGGREILNLKLIAALLVAKNIALPFLSFDGSQPLATWLHLALNHGQLPIAVPITLVVVASAMALLFGRAAPAWWLAASGLLLALISYYGALLPTNDMVEPHLGGRYSFVPQVLFALSLVAAATTGTGKSTSVRRALAGLLVAWLCVASTDAYLHPAATFTKGPSWHKEVAKYRHDPHYAPEVWPGGSWRIRLSRIHD